MFVHLVVIGWLYVVVMMTVAEASSPQGTLLGAFFTLLLYGLLPLALVLYLLGAPGRRRAIKAREMADAADANRAACAADPPSASADGTLPDADRHAATGTVAPVRKEP
jgi:hypothetical protein